MKQRWRRRSIKTSAPLLGTPVECKVFPSAKALVSSGEGWHAVLENARDNMFLAFNFADFGRGDSHHSMLVSDVEVLGSGDLFFCMRKMPRTLSW